MTSDRNQVQHALVGVAGSPSLEVVSVQVVDASGNQITSFGGGTQYTEGDTDSTITGTALLWEDTGDTLRSVSAAKPLPVNVTTVGAGENHIGEFGGRTAVVSATFARPADTNAYAALDAVSNSTSAPTVLTFTNLARIVQGSGYISKARLFTDQSANTARFRLHLFHTAPTAINDNAAYTLLWANRDKRIGHIDFDPMATEGSGSDAASALNAILRLPFNCAASDRNLYGLLQTKDIFTPASAQNFYIELTADLN